MKNTVTASQAILQVLLLMWLFTPVSYPKGGRIFDCWKRRLIIVAKLVCSAFLKDFTAEELDGQNHHAYDSKVWWHQSYVPLVKLWWLNNLELFHLVQPSPLKIYFVYLATLIFQPSRQEARLENKIIILIATSERLLEKLQWQVLRSSQVLRTSSLSRTVASKVQER